MAVRATRDAEDKRTQMRRDYRIDESQVISPQRGKHYKPVNVKRVDHWKQRGYIVTPWDSKAKLLGASKSEKNSGQQCGDLILMETTVEIRNARIRRSRDKQKFQENAYRESARENVNRIARDEAGVRSRKDLVVDTSSETDEDED